MTSSSPIRDIFEAHYIGPHRPFRLGERTVYITDVVPADSDGIDGIMVFIDSSPMSRSHSERVAYSSLSPLFDTSRKPVRVADDTPTTSGVAA